MYEGNHIVRLPANSRRLSGTAVIVSHWMMLFLPLLVWLVVVKVGFFFLLLEIQTVTPDCQPQQIHVRSQANRKDEANRVASISVQTKRTINFARKYGSERQTVNQIRCFCTIPEVLQTPRPEAGVQKCVQKQ